MPETEAGESREDEEAEDGSGKIQRELSELKRRNEELLTRLKYAQADLENYRKRMDRELKDAGESLARVLVTRLLVVQDELDLAVKHAQEGTGGKELMEGISMVQRNLLSALQDAGVEKIEAVGRPFDPSIHEAVAKAQGGTHGQDVVVDEMRPGFKFRGQVLRPSMVKVELAAKGEEKVNE
ncbi:MAG: nucleotide exchange factor GrpE [Nitrososphaerota archaeon]|nr:nucleotide exchange factor GrpE [Nitrososphaerota archaeon]